MEVGEGFLGPWGTSGQGQPGQQLTGAAERRRGGRRHGRKRGFGSSSVEVKRNGGGGKKQGQAPGLLIAEKRRCGPHAGEQQREQGPPGVAPGHISAGVQVVRAHHRLTAH